MNLKPVAKIDVGSRALQYHRRLTLCFGEGVKNTAAG